MGIPELIYSPIDTIQPTHARVNATFLSQKTKPLEYRLTQLRQLWWAIKNAEPELLEACKLDLGKSAFESYLTEIGWCLNDIIYVCNNLKSWMKEEKAKDVEFIHWAVQPRIQKSPMGVVLVLGAYNFPVQLSLGPLIGAIAAGCTAVLKPSESSPHTAVVMQDIVAKSLDPESYTVLQGGVAESTKLLECKWDKIFFTGGGTVGQTIAKKAAETLTPVTLELGGKNPAIVTRTADPRLAARRLLWAKSMNAGQVCVSQNYILVDKEILPALIEEMKHAMKEFYPQGVRNSPDFARIVNERQWSRLKKMLDDTKGKILIGGGMDAATKYLEPTVVQVSDPSDSMLVDESFGPLIPILPVDNVEAAIATANKIDPTPLALYAFGNKASTDKILSETRSGGASVNDGFYHASIATLEFGGVGSSGQGSYRGKASFDCFTHRRAVTDTPGWIERILAIRYPPYTGKLARFKFMSELKADFGPDGRVTSASYLNGWTMRVVLLSAAVFGARKVMTSQGM